MLFSRDFAEHSRKCWEVLEFWDFLKKRENFSWILTRILTEFWCEKFEWFDRSPIEPFNPVLRRMPRFWPRRLRAKRGERCSECSSPLAPRPLAERPRSFRVCAAHADVVSFPSSAGFESNLSLLAAHRSCFPYFLHPFLRTCQMKFQHLTKNTQ